MKCINIRNPAREKEKLADIEIPMKLYFSISDKLMIKLRKKQAIIILKLGVKLPFPA